MPFLPAPGSGFPSFIHCTMRSMRPRTRRAVQQQYGPISLFEVLAGHAGCPAARKDRLLNFFDLIWSLFNCLIYCDARWATKPPTEPSASSPNRARSAGAALGRGDHGGARGRRGRGCGREQPGQPAPRVGEEAGRQHEPAVGPQEPQRAQQRVDESSTPRRAACPRPRTNVIPAQSTSAGASAASSRRRPAASG